MANEVGILDARVSENAPGLTVNRSCGSGAQAIVSADQDEFGAEKININSDAIALGHPSGATSSKKALHEIERIGGRYGLIPMCADGGQGIGLAIENLK